MNSFSKSRVGTCRAGVRIAITHPHDRIALPESSLNLRRHAIFSHFACLLASLNIEVSYRVMVDRHQPHTSRCLRCAPQLATLARRPWVLFDGSEASGRHCPSRFCHRSLH
ncbi:uncharacterized protein PHALS_00400 [Plasmopara halstedii]|uniref:Uncharacterized protein n=1 Tax=Plasmopara halstedii TaxID=4781 RepID=A0A0P1A695_PLAHL|nr:uncharacterized protein PHALS_00400 [Plasmopara halstedii]CEG36080.1 hypothetical protein PHALS_00400 [Plasmopara halstedii]|eukprot:XP_024572449.1 hypothetical protein PHALS_00400 [Plasmopara halstedii]